jgi:hypothetical protein
LSLNGIFQFLRYDSVKCHTCFIFNQTFLLNTMLFLLFQMLQMTADEIILNCKCLVLQSHLDAMLKKSVTLIPKTSNTISHNSFEIKHSKNKCLTDSISLQRLHFLCSCSSIAKTWEWLAETYSLFFLQWSSCFSLRIKFEELGCRETE